MSRYDILLKKVVQKSQLSIPQYRRLYVGGKASGKTTILMKDVNAIKGCAFVYLNHFDGVKRKWLPFSKLKNISVRPLGTQRNRALIGLSDNLFFDDLPMKDYFYSIAESVHSRNARYIAITCDFVEFMNFIAKDSSLCRYIKNYWIVEQLKWPSSLNF